MTMNATNAATNKPNTIAISTESKAALTHIRFTLLLNLRNI